MTNDPYRPPTEAPPRAGTNRPPFVLSPTTAAATLCWSFAVFPILAFVDMFVDRFLGVNGWPNALPITSLVLGLIVGGVLWIRAFLLWDRRFRALSPTASAVIAFPIWLAISGSLTLPVLILGWHIATQSSF